MHVSAAETTASEPTPHPSEAMIGTWVSAMRGIDQPIARHLVEQATEARPVQHRELRQFADGLTVLVAESRQGAPHRHRHADLAERAPEIELVLPLDRGEVMHRVIGDAVRRFHRAPCRGAGCVVSAAACAWLRGRL